MTTETPFKGITAQGGAFTAATSTAATSTGVTTSAGGVRKAKLHPHSSRVASQADAFCTSGPSPTLHIVGAGPVGLALLERAVVAGLRVIAVSDSGGTAFDSRGVDVRSVSAAKAQSKSVASLPSGRSIDTDLALSLVDADLVADCSSSSRETEAKSAARVLALLDRQRGVALAAKDALVHAPTELTTDARAAHLGFHAVLGATGASLHAELDSLRAEVRSVACVPNATTTAILESIERGSDFDAALAQAVTLGLCERDATRDLTGIDAAVKLAIVASLLSGTDRALEEVVLPQPLQSLAPDELRERHSRGATTRLVGRLAAGGELSLSYEEVRRASTLAVPSSQVVYAYDLGCGRSRVHHGAGLGAVRTAEAVLSDLLRLAPACSPTEGGAR